MKTMKIHEVFKTWQVDSEKYFWKYKWLYEPKRLLKRRAIFRWFTLPDFKIDIIFSNQFKEEDDTDLRIDI